MSDESVVRVGVSVWVGGNVKASASVVEVVSGRRVGADGPFQLGEVRVRVDATGREVVVNAAEIEQVL